MPRQQSRPRSDCFWSSSLIWVFPVCYSDKHFCDFQPWKQTFYLGTEREKCLKCYKLITSWYIVKTRHDWFLCSSQVKIRADLWPWIHNTIPIGKQHRSWSAGLQCQTVWILIRPDILLALIWVQTVCKALEVSWSGSTLFIKNRYFLIEKDKGF